MGKRHPLVSPGRVGPGTAFIMRPPWNITMRLSAFLAIAVPTVARGHTMVSFQVPDSAQSTSWRASLSPSWDVSFGGLAAVMAESKISQGVRAVPHPRAGTTLPVPIVPSES